MSLVSKNLQRTISCCFTYDYVFHVITVTIKFNKTFSCILKVITFYMKVIGIKISTTFDTNFYLFLCFALVKTKNMNEIFTKLMIL